MSVVVDEPINDNVTTIVDVVVKQQNTNDNVEPSLQQMIGSSISTMNDNNRYHHSTDDPLFRNKVVSTTLIGQHSNEAIKTKQLIQQQHLQATATAATNLIESIEGSCGIAAGDDTTTTSTVTTATTTTTTTTTASCINGRSSRCSSSSSTGNKTNRPGKRTVTTGSIESVTQAGSETNTSYTTTEGLRSITISSSLSKIRFHDRHLMQIRSKEIDTIVQCFTQTIGVVVPATAAPAPAIVVVPEDRMGAIATTTTISEELQQRQQQYDPRKETILPIASTLLPKSNETIHTTSVTSTSSYTNGTTTTTRRTTSATFGCAMTATTTVPTNTTTNSSSSIVVVVTGPSGSGKATLVRQALQNHTIQQRNGYYIRGLFDMVQHPDPYRAFTSAFTDYTYQVVERGGPSRIIAVRNAIITACGSETHVLTQMIPALSAIIHYKDNTSSSLNYNNKMGTKVGTPNNNSSSNNNSFVDIDDDISRTNRTVATDVSKEQEDNDNDDDDDIRDNDDDDGPNNNTGSNNTPLPNDDAIKRFVFVFQKFLRAIASIEHPIVLVLENVQYADDCSVDILCSIMNDLQSIAGLFVICTYNGTDLSLLKDPSHDDTDTKISSNSNTNISYFTQHIRDIERERNGSILVQTIPIDHLSYEEVQFLLGQTLQQSTHFDIAIDDDLCTLVMEETNGNLYRMMELLRWLVDQHLLLSSCPTNCSSGYTYWKWDMNDIQRAILDQKTMDDGRRNDSCTDYPLSSKLERLPTEYIEVLKVGACFGSSHMEESLIEYVLDFPVSTIIADLIEMEIFVTYLDGYGQKQSQQQQLCFVHEMMQLAVYNLISKSTCEIRHLEIGRRLWRRMDRNDLDRSLFVVLSQMYKGRKLISRATERYSIATLCLHAARKAAKSSTFRVSLIYLKFGIELLGERGWRDEYDLTLSMYNAAAEMEVCTANYAGMELIIAPILKNARCTDDTIQARTTAVYAYGVCDRQQEALALGVQLLSDLGSALPRNFCVWSLWTEMKSVLSLLKGKSNDYIKRLPVIEDDKVLASLHVLNMMYLHSLLLGHKMSVFIALRMMKLTLTHGLSFISPLAFSTFGMICIKVFPTTDLAFRYGELSLELLDRFKVREYLPRVYACYYACIFPWRYPLPESVDHLIHAYHVGMQTGDVEFACLCANLWSFISMETDKPLDEVEHQWTNFQMRMKANGQTSSLRMSMSCLQLIQYYQGKDVDFTETDELLEFSIKNKLASTRTGITWGRARMALLFNDLHRADELAYSICRDFDKLMQASPPTCELVQIPFLNGLIALTIVSQLKRRDFTPLRTRKQYIREGKRMIQLIKKYALWSPTNFVDKQLFLEAELAVAEGKHEVAMQKYVCAIASSKVSRNLFVHGLANERAGKHCLFQMNQPVIAKSYLNAALVAFAEWKAHRKVDHLRKEMEHFDL